MGLLWGDLKYANCVKHLKWSHLHSKHCVILILELQTFIYNSKIKRILKIKKSSPKVWHKLIWQQNLIWTDGKLLLVCIYPLFCINKLKKYQHVWLWNAAPQPQNRCNIINCIFVYFLKIWNIFNFKTQEFQRRECEPIFHYPLLARDPV